MVPEQLYEQSVEKGSWLQEDSINAIEDTQARERGVSREPVQCSIQVITPVRFITNHFPAEFDVWLVLKVTKLARKGYSGGWLNLADVAGEKIHKPFLQVLGVEPSKRRL